MSKGSGSTRNQYPKGGFSFLNNPVDSSITEGYVGSLKSFVINRKLRNGEPLDKELSEVVDRLDGAMKPAPKSFNVVRYVLYDYLNQLGIKSDAKLSGTIGKKVTEKAYISTSYDENKNGVPWGPGMSIKMNIRVSKGTKMIVTPNEKESEVILGRNTSYVINDVKKIDGLYNLYVTTV